MLFVEFLYLLFPFTFFGVCYANLNKIDCWLTSKECQDHCEVQCLEHDNVDSKNDFCSNQIPLTIQQKIYQCLENNSTNELAGWQILLICLAALVLVALIAGGVFYVYKKKSLSRKKTYTINA